MSSNGQKIGTFFSAGLAVILIATALVFSIVFDWRGTQLQTTEMQFRAGEPCKDDEREARARAGATTASSKPPLENTDELAELAPEQEDQLAADGALAPAELLGISEGLAQLDVEPTNVRTPAALPVTPAPAQPEAPREALPAPEKLSPARKADLRRKLSVRFHWEPVSGAAAYKVQAWQLDAAGKKIIILDEQTTQTELRAEPKLDSSVLWTVAAIDAEGNQGELAGPIAIDLLKSETPVPRRLPSGR